MGRNNKRAEIQLGNLVGRSLATRSLPPTTSGIFETAAGGKFIGEPWDAALYHGYPACPVEA
jgi:hypothetical protein